MAQGRVQGSLPQESSQLGRKVLEAALTGALLDSCCHRAQRCHGPECVGQTACAAREPMCPGAHTLCTCPHPAFLVAITLSIVPLSSKMITEALAPGGMHVRARFPLSSAVSAVPASSIPLGRQPTAQVFMGPRTGLGWELGVPLRAFVKRTCRLWGLPHGAFHSALRETGPSPAGVSKAM